MFYAVARYERRQRITSACASASGEIGMGVRSTSWIAALALVAQATIASAQPTVEPRLASNRTALGIATQQPTRSSTATAQDCVVGGAIADCASLVGSSQAVGLTGGSLIVLLGAIAAVGLGIVVAVGGDDDTNGGVTPVSP
ncbi:hypothetical protein [Sphingomonas qomolangmaensis]|uniref:Uncharacterized protein n=1 Tax=Sphingomonas qomolangmaensis TaxID=2918765 RepID=A0ABY5L6A0_9SPHN|nr:hypothetical protein [Sphingomonas qomolangmaensis]UUL82475.1 hypothetical protein NMP03_15100 [Sphingomonas qomolangmaensis]